MPRNTTEHTAQHFTRTTEPLEDSAADFRREAAERYEEKKLASEHFSAALQEADGHLAREVAQVYDGNTDTKQASWMNQDWNEPGTSGDQLMLAYQDAAQGLSEYQQRYLASELARAIAMPAHESSTSFSQDWDMERGNVQVFDQHGYDLLMEKVAQGFRENWQDTEEIIADSLYEGRNRDVTMMRFGDASQPVDNRLAYLHAIGELQELQRDIEQAALHGTVPEHIQDPDLREDIEVMKMARGERLLEAHVEDLARAMPQVAQDDDPRTVLSYTGTPDYPAVLRDFTENHSQGDQQILLEQIAAASRRPQEATA